MEQCSPFAWMYYNEDERMMGEMRQYIVQSRMELEATIFGAQEEIMRKEEELLHTKDLLMLTIKERDEAQFKLHNTMLEKLHLQQQLQLKKPGNKQKKTINSLSSSSSESEDSSTTTTNGGVFHHQEPPTLPPQMEAQLVNRRPLPEKGKLLKAVMEAGPLLQTLLLAGPLPQWQHPPPQLDTIEIPPITINISPRKRALDNNTTTNNNINSNVDCSLISSPKYPRVA